MPTFTTSRPRSSPGNRPAGLWQCQPWEKQRWTDDQFRYPPYVYRDKNCLVNEAGEHRLPTISEKEITMGFPLHYTETCMPKNRQQGSQFADARHTLVGNAWHVGVISWLLMQLFNPLGMTECKTLADTM